MENAGNAVIDFGRFCTGFLVVMGVGMFDTSVMRWGRGVGEGRYQKLLADQLPLQLYPFYSRTVPSSHCLPWPCLLLEGYSSTALSLVSHSSSKRNKTSEYSRFGLLIGFLAGQVRRKRSGGSYGYRVGSTG